MNSRILLVNTPDTGSQSLRWDRKLKNKLSTEPPIGLCYIAGLLNTKFPDVRVLDAYSMGMSIEQLMKYIRDYNPAVVGLGCSASIMLNAVKDISKAIREYDKSIIIVAGGYLQSHKESFLQEKNVDFIIRGEAEFAFLELCDAALNKNGDISKILGLSYLKDGKVIDTPNRPLLKNIDVLPFAARHLLEPSITSGYYKTAYQYKRKPYTMSVSSRGCPYKCTFCGIHNIWSYDYRPHSAEYVVNEIKYLQENWGIKDIKYHDDNFLVDTERVKKISDLIVSEGIDISWSCLGTIATINNNSDLIPRMKKGGCWHIGFGIETGNAQVMRDIKKPTTIEQVRSVITACAKNGIATRGLFMMGHPTDTKETIKETIAFAKSLPFYSINFAFAIPYPGTEMYEIVKNGAGSFEEDTDFMSGHSAHPVFVPAGLTKEYMMAEQRRAYREFYFRPGFILQRLSEIRNFTQFNNLTKLAISHVKTAVL